MFSCLPNLLTFSVLRFPWTEDLHLLFPRFLKQRFSWSLFSHVWRVLFHLRAVLCWIIRGWGALTCSLLAVQSALNGSMLFITCTSQIWLTRRYDLQKLRWNAFSKLFFYLCSALYYSDTRLAVFVAGMRERYLYNTLVGKHERKRQLGRSRRSGRIILKFVFKK